MSQDHTLEGWCLLVAGEPLMLYDGRAQFMPLFVHRSDAIVYASRHSISGEIVRAGSAVKHKPCRKACEGRARGLPEAIAKVRASAAQLGRTVQEFEARFGPQAQQEKHRAPTTHQGREKPPPA